MSSSAVAQKYAKCLFDVCYENGSAGVAAQQLFEVVKAFDAGSIGFFQSPLNTVETKVSVVRAALEGKCSAEVFNFVCLLAENSRVQNISEISKEFSSLVQSAAGITKGKLFSAVDVSKEFLKQVEDQVSKSLNKKVELSVEKDPTLIAGYKVQVGGWTMDDSADAHLKMIKNELMKRGL